MKRRIKKDDGGPAFGRAGFWPVTSGIDRDDLRDAMATKTEPTNGMSLRDWLAGQALVSLIQTNSGANWECRTAEMAYRVADAMLAARTVDRWQDIDVSDDD